MANFGDDHADLDAGLLAELRSRMEVDPVDRDPISFAREETLTRLAAAPEFGAGIPDVGVAILAGGLATRFGGVPKAAVRLTNGRTLLDIKLRAVLDACADWGAAIPVIVVASPATRVALETLLEPWKGRLPQARIAVQSTWPRLAPGGDVAIDDHGGLDQAPKGHGEVLRLLAEASDRISNPPRHWFVSNIDNVFATPSREVFALHISSGAAATVEVVHGRPEDVGGYLAELGDRFRILEGFQVPADRRPRGRFLFRTNSFVLGPAAVGAYQRLPIHPVRKQGRSGETVVQFERLLGDLGTACPLNAVVVPRDGVDSRFIALKTREQFAGFEREVEAWLSAHGSSDRIVAG